MDYPHQFTAQEEQVLGRLFVEHVRTVVPNVTFFDVFKHLAALDDDVDIDPKEYTPVALDVDDERDTIGSFDAPIGPDDFEDVFADEFGAIVAGVASPVVMDYDDGLDYITAYMRHGGKVTHVEEWLGVPLDNALDVLAFGINEGFEDQETMLAWTQKEWCDIEAALKSTRGVEGWPNERVAGHISDRHNVSEATADIILGWYGR